MGPPSGSDGKETAYNAEDLGLIAGLGSSPGEGHGNPLQHSCLENPMDRRVHRITNNWTWLKQLSMHTNALNIINNTGISKRVILYFFFSFTFQDLFPNMCLLICYTYSQIIGAMALFSKQLLIVFESIL